MTRPPAPWTIIDVELGDRRGPFAPSVSTPVVVRFRLDGAVIGEAPLMPADLPMSAEEFAAFAAPAIGPALDQIGRLGLGDDRIRPGPPLLRPLPVAGDDYLSRARAALSARRDRPVAVTASIVICTCRRPVALVGCLDALKTEIALDREVIVVDNGPDSKTEAIVRDRPAIRYIPEPTPGLSRARNTGVRAARGEVVVFVDDDVRPEPGWIGALLRRFDAPEVGIVCGLVLPETLETEAQIGFQYDLGFGGMAYGPLVFDQAFLENWPDAVPVWSIGAGANMAVRRTTVLALGGFDTRLGPGAAGGCGDDSEFWHRALFAGHRAIYEPLSVVRHQHRRDLAALKRQAYGYSFGHVVALFAQYARNRDRGDLHRAFVTLPLFYGAALLRQPRAVLAGRGNPLLGAWIRGLIAGLARVHFAFSRPLNAVPPAPPQPQETPVRAK